MINRPPYVPAHAERLSIETCVTAVQVPSEYAPGATALKLMLRCPSCRSTQVDAAFRCQTIAVCSCGLCITVEPYAVFIWRLKSPREVLRRGGVTRDTETMR